jgi:hypothetical protein
MPHERSTADGPSDITRRRFIQSAAAITTATCVSPSLLLGCRVSPTSTAATSTSADTMDEALQRMAALAPLGNHGPMAAEALVILGCGDRVMSFVDSYKKRFTFTTVPTFVKSPPLGY